MKELEQYKGSEDGRSGHAARPPVGKGLCAEWGGRVTPDAQARTLRPQGL